jgi:hypothetical protein
VSLAVPFAYAAPVEFAILPAGGSIVASPSETIGWGYSITNTTVHYLLPLGLANSGVVYGTLDDIFDYPVVDPGQTIAQQYVFNSPGGWGNSFGLYEYILPLDMPPGFVQTGTFLFTYQLYDDNPDLNPFASPVAPPETLSAPFELTVEASQVPEPATFMLVAIGVVAGILRRRV